MWRPAAAGAVDGGLPQARISFAIFTTLFREIWVGSERNSTKFGGCLPKFRCERNLGAFKTKFWPGLTHGHGHAPPLRARRASRPTRRFDMDDASVEQLALMREEVDHPNLSTFKKPSEK